MKNLIIPVLLFSIFLSFSFNPIDFFDSQLTYSRVKNANDKKGKEVNSLLEKQGVSPANYDLFIRCFKSEKSMEVWAKNKNDNSYKLITSYDFCATTGVLGPKRRSGDKQIPEGFYKVDKFNPQSQYHLSFRINYPNKSDLVFADKLNPGDNIFIHGDCLTIGCIPIGNENIEELYLLAIKAKSGGGNLDVHIFPTKMTDENIKKLSSENKELKTFWSWLKPGFDAFENTKVLPNITILDDGKYNISN